MNGADLTSVVPILEMRGENDEETRGLARMFDEAQEFLSSFGLCRHIEESFFGFGYAGIVAVFLFRIDPARVGIDEWLWVIVGDLPPAYLVTEGNLTPELAVAGYIEEMSRWVQAAREGRSVRDLIPVHVRPNPENAEAMERRLGALKEIINPTLQQRSSSHGSREVH
jgi:hypothetical protein